jgi:hypothetical protein
VGCRKKKGAIIKKDINDHWFFRKNIKIRFKKVELRKKLDLDNTVMWN